MNGFLLIDKPENWTSHDVVAHLRGVTGIRQIGHGGTLDPFATGLLILGLGSATKLLATFLKGEKEYLAAIRLGGRSDTDDRTGNIQETPRPLPEVTTAALEKVLERFRGEIEQVPPMYSAKKIAGKKLYEIARKGETVERASVGVRIDEFTVLENELPERFRARIVCGSGTYIRALARDIGEALGVGGYLEELRRTRIGAYRIENAIPLKNIDRNNWKNFIVTP